MRDALQEYPERRLLRAAAHQESCRQVQIHVATLRKQRGVVAAVAGTEQLLNAPPNHVVGVGLFTPIMDLIHTG